MFTFAHGFLNGAETAEAATLVLHAATYNASTYLVGDETVSGTPTFIHTSDIYAKDFNDVDIVFRENERVVKNGRTVTNLVKQSEAFTDSAGYWKTDSDASFDDNTTVRFTAAQGDFSVDSTNSDAVFIINGFNYIFSVELEHVSGPACLIQLKCENGIGENSVNVTVASNEQKRITLAFTALGDVTSPYNIIRCLTDVSAVNGVFNFHGAQFEDSTGRTNVTIPYEYIDTNTDIKTVVFANENGNTVTDNVVTSVVSDTLLSPLPMTIYQRASENLFLNSDVPVTQNVTVINAADYVVWVDGGAGNVVLSGAATGTVTEAGGFVTFSASTTTLTLTYTATLDHVQVEAGVIPTGKITTDGSTAATDETVNTYPSANWSNSDGPVYLIFDYKGIDENILLNNDVAILYVASDVLYLNDGTNTASIACSTDGEHEVGIVLDTTGNKMKLNLDGTYSTEANYDNSFGTGNITVEADIREYKRKDESSYTAQQTILDGWMP